MSILEVVSTPPDIDQEQIATSMRAMIEAIGEDPTREGLVDTPARVGRMYAEIIPNGKLGWRVVTEKILGARIGFTTMQLRG